MKERSTFASKFGTIVVIGGSVVGLGNIWRFPYIVGENGGAAFLLVYIAISLLISVPLMLSEFTIGRSSQKNAWRAFKTHSSNPFWQAVGLMGIATAFMILGFYSVVAGWALEFFFNSAAGNFIGKTPEELSSAFNEFVAEGSRPIFFTLIFVATTAYVVGRGVVKGIEKFNKILMPLMVIILLGLVVNSFFLTGFTESIVFLFKPDFSKLTWRVGLEALGQSFFSMSLGMGAMITYGSYMKKSDNMFITAGSVALSDLVIALLAGIAIFPAVFSFNINMTSGPELVFLTLPNIFSQMTGGYFIGITFFFMLFVAAITSSMSLLEVIVAYTSEEFKLSRRIAVIGTAIVVAGISSICAISQMPNSSLKVAGMNIFDLLNSITATYTMPIGAVLIVLFAGWVLSRKKFVYEITNKGKVGRWLIVPLRIIIRFVVPVVIAILFLAKIGLI